MMTVERVDTGVPRQRPIDQVHRASPGWTRKRLAAIAGVLLLSAIVYCVLVVWQRDNLLRNAAIDRVVNIQVWVQEFLDERSFLPPALPDDLLDGLGTPLCAYPHRHDVPHLRGLTGPYMLLAGPRQGLIMPGHDGCAVVMYDHGTIRTTWMSLAAVEAESQKREALLKNRQRR